MNEKFKKLTLSSLFAILLLSILPLSNLYADEINQINEEISTQQEIANEESVVENNSSIPAMIVDNALDVNEESVKSFFKDYVDSFELNPVEIQKISNKTDDLGLVSLINLNQEDHGLIIVKGQNVVLNDKYALQAGDISISEEEYNQLGEDAVISTYSQLSVYNLENGNLVEGATYQRNGNEITYTFENLSLTKSIEIYNEQAVYANSKGVVAPLHNRVELEALGRNNNAQTAITYGNENLQNDLNNADETISVTTWDDFKRALQRSNVNLKIEVASDITVTSTFVTGSNATYSITSTGGKINLGDFGTTITTQQNVRFNFYDIVIDGGLAEDTVKNRGWDSQLNSNKGAYVSFLKTANDGNNYVNLYDGFEFKNLMARGSWGGFLYAGLGTEVNMFGGKFTNVIGYVGACIVMSYDGTKPSYLNVFGGSFVNNYSLAEGVIDNGDGAAIFTNYWAGSIRDNFSGGTLGATPYQDTIHGVRNPNVGKLVINGATFDIGNNWTLKKSKGNENQNGQAKDIAAFYYWPIEPGRYSGSSVTDALTGRDGINMYLGIELLNFSPKNSAFISHGYYPMETYWDTLWKNKDTFKLFGGVPLAEITYSDDNLKQKYFNNGITEGIESGYQFGLSNDEMGWGDASVSTSGQFRVVEKEVGGRTFVTLVKSYTEVEVQAVDKNGNTIDSGKYNYKNIITSNTESKLPIPSIADKYPTSIELVSNTQTNGDMTTAQNPTNFPQTPGKNDTEFTIKDNNNVGGKDGNIYKTVIKIVYDDVKHYEILANDALATSAEAKAAASDINNKLIQWMKANVKNLNTNTNLDDPSKIVVDSANINDIKAGTPGTYDVTFKFVDDQTVSKTVKLTIVDDSYVVTPDRQGYVKASNGRISSNTAKTLTSVNDIITYVNASGMYNDVVATVGGQPNLSIATSQFSDIKQGKPGVYQVEAIVDGDNNLQTTHDQARKTVTLTVYETVDTVPTPDGLGSITAQNTVITSSEAKVLANKEVLIATMKASAEYNGQVVDVTVNDNKNFTNIKNGVINTNGYKITFSMDADNNPSTIEDNQSISKYLYVVNDDVTITPDKKGFIGVEEIWYRSEDAINNFVEDKFIFENMYGVASYDGQTYSLDGTSVTMADTNKPSIKTGTVGDWDATFTLTIPGVTTVSATKPVHVVDNETSVTGDRFGFVSGTTSIIYNRDVAKQTFAGKQPQDILNIYGVQAQYKGEDFKSQLQVESTDWKKIQEGVVNSNGWQVTLSLDGKVEGTNNDELTRELTVIIRKSNTRDELRVADNGKYAPATIGDYNTPSLPAGGTLVPDQDGAGTYAGFIDGYSKTITSDGIKEIFSNPYYSKPFYDLTELGDVTGNCNKHYVTITDFEPIDPNWPAIEEKLAAGVPGNYVIWFSIPVKSSPNEYWSQPVEFVVVPNNTKLNQQKIESRKNWRNSVTWAQVDKTKTIKNTEAQALNITNIDDVANEMNLISRGRIGGWDAEYNKPVLAKEYFEKVNPEILDFVEPVSDLDNYNPDQLTSVADQNKVLNDIKSGKVGKYYIRVKNDSVMPLLMVRDGLEYEMDLEQPATSVGCLEIVEADGSISANNFVVSTQVAGTLTDDQVKQKANVKAIYDNQPVPMNQINVDQTQLQAIQNAGKNDQVGTYPLTFEANGSTTTVNVSIYNDDTSTDNDADKDNANVFLQATSPIKVQASDVADFKQNWNDAKYGMNAKAWNKTGDDLTSSIQANTSKVSNTLGAYEVELSVLDPVSNKSANKTVIVNVVDQNTECNNGVCITANPINLLQSEIGVYNADMAIDRAQPIKAWLEDQPNSTFVDINGTTQIGKDYLTVNSADITNVNQIAGPNTYADYQGFSASKDGKTFETKVDVIVSADNMSDSNAFSIKATQNLAYPLSQAPSLTGNQMRDDLHAKGGITIINKNGVDVTSTMISKVQADSTVVTQINQATEMSQYDLEFSLGASKSNAIKVTIYDDDAETDKPTDKPNANIYLDALRQIDLSTNEAQLPGLMTVDQFNKDVKGNIQAVAYHRDGVTPVTIDITPSSVNNVVGVQTLTVTATDGTNTTTPLYVKVNVKDENTNCDGNVCITAKNFTVNLADIVGGTYTKEQAIKDAQVIAWTQDGTVLYDATKSQGDISNVEFDNADFTKLMSQTISTSLNGMTFKVVGHTAATDVTATIVDNVNYTIHANNFAISSKEAKQITEAIAKQKANVTVSPVASKVQDVVANATQLQTIKSGIVGIYDLEFSLPGVSKTIKVTVYDDNTNTDSDQDKDNAQIFLIADNQVKLRTNSSTTNTSLPTVAEFNKDIVAGTNAKAWLVDGTPASVVVEPNSQQVLDKAGLYVVKLKGTNNNGLNTSVKDVFVSVVDDNTNCNGNVCITAKPIALYLSEVKSYDSDLAITRGEPQAWYTDKADVINQNQINVNSSDINTVKAQTSATTLTKGQGFSFGGAEARVDVQITDDPYGSFTITAQNNIVLSSDDAKVVDSQTLVQKAGVKVINANGVDVTANVIDQVAANAAQLGAINTGVVGFYPLKFELNGSESNEIRVSVYDDNTDTDNNGDKDNANVFLDAISPVYVKTNEAQLAGLPSVDQFNADVLTYTEAKAWHKDSNVSVTITPTTASIPNAPGRYVVKLTATATDGKSATKDVVVIVKNDNTTCNDQVCIVANNFNQNLTEVSGLTEDVAKQKADVQAFYINKPGTPTITVNNGQLSAIQGLTQMPTNNPMDLTFSAEGVDAPVKVTIVDNQYTITANNFNVDFAELPLNEAGVVNKSNATATNNATGQAGTVKVEQSSLDTLNATKEGVVAVTLFVDEQPSVTTTIKVNVIPDGAVVGDKSTITANSPVTIKLSEVLKGQEADLFTLIKTEANARAWYNDGTKPDPTITYDKTQMKNILAQTQAVNDLDFTFIVEGDAKAKKTIKVNIVDDTQIILPGQDGNMGTDDDVHVKPNPDQNGNYPTIKPDGSVDLPNGGEITIPGTGNDDVIVTPPGSNIKPDGTITTPGGNEVMPEPEGGVELPGNDGKLPAPDNVDNPVVKPEGDGPVVVNPDGSVTLPDDEKGEITFPNNPGNDDITQIPGGSTVSPDGTVETPDGGIVKPNPDGGVELPGDDGKLPTPDHVDNPLVKPEGDGPIVVNPDGSVTLPTDEEGTITYPNNPGNDGTVNIPGGSTVSPDGIVTPPNGGSPVDTDEDGSLKVPGPNEQLGDADDVVVKPNGDAIITPEGGVELPNGGTIVPDDGNGKEWPVNPGTVVNPNGSISLPGNNPQISFDPVIRPNGDGSITVPGKDGVFDENGDNDHRVEGPGITFDPENGNVSLPNGGTVTKPGGQQVTVPNGTIVLPDGTIIIPTTGINQIPVITINSSPSYTYDQATETITINQNTPFDAAKIATATDAEDGDITKDLAVNVARTKQVVNGSVDTSIAPSEWNVDYSVIDSQGASTRKTVKVIVVQTATAPVINGVRDQEVTVGKDIDLMAGVTAEDYQGNDLTNKIVISVTDPNGNVSTDINTMIIGEHKVTYTVTDANGLTTSETCTVTVKPIILPGQDNKPGTDDDVIVSPDPEGPKPEFKPDGGVELPGGGDIEFPGGGGADVPPGSIVTPGGDVITPDNNVPVRPQPPTNDKPGGSIELPGNDGELGDPNNPNDPDREDNPVVTPEGPNKPIIKPDGGVELPDGGDIEYPNNPDNPGGSITVPPGSVVNPDGSVETPEGGQVDTDEDGTITLPGQDDELGTDDDVVVKPGGNGDATINPDGSVTVPGGGEITFPNKPDHNGTITIPGGSTVKPDGTVETPSGDVVRPNPDGTIQLPGQDDQLGTDDDVIVKPGGNGDATIKPDGSVDLPNGGDISFPNKPEAGMEVPSGSNVGQDGTVTAPNGDQSRPNVDGTITVPGHDEEFGTADDGIIYPNPGQKPVLNPDGTITMPEGGVIKFPGLGDCEIEILPGGYVDSHGVVYNPIYEEGSTVTRASNLTIVDWEVLDPAVVCAIEPTVTPEPTKPTNTGAMSSVFTLLVAIAVSGVAVYTLRRRK